MADDQKQDEKGDTDGAELREGILEENLDEARRGPQPMKRHNAGRRADQAARSALADVTLHVPASVWA